MRTLEPKRAGERWSLRDVRVLDEVMRWRAMNPCVSCAWRSRHDWQAACRVSWRPCVSCTLGSRVCPARPFLCVRHA